MTFLIGVIAGNHDQFIDWVEEECKVPTSFMRVDRNVFVTPKMTMRYIASPDAARGITFDMIILTGRYADKWSDDDIEFLERMLG